MPGTNVIVSASQITIGTKMSASKMIITTGTTVIVIGALTAPLLSPPEALVAA